MQPLNVQTSMKGGKSVDHVLNPIEIDNFPPLNPSFDGDSLGYDMSREAEGMFIRNYFATFRPDNFHTEELAATCIFEDQRRRNTNAGIQLKRKMILATGAKNGTIKLWNILKGTHSKDLEFHTGLIKSIVTYDLPNGNTRIISGSVDKYVAIWDYNSGTKFTEILRKDPVHCLAVCQSTGMLAIGSADRKIAIYNIKGDKISDIAEIADFLTIHTDLILSLSIISPDKFPAHSKIVSVGWDKRMVVWDRNGKQVDQFDKGHTKSITTLIAHMPSGEEENTESTPILVTGSLDKTAIIWDFATGKKVRVLEGHKGQVNAVKISDRDDDGSPPIVITASADKTIILWDLISGFRIRTIEHYEPLNTLSIFDSAEGVVIISSGTTPGLLLWDLRRTQRSRTFETGAVTTIDVYSPPVTGQVPQLIIGDVQRKFTTFALNDPELKLSEHQFHTKRINASALYTPIGHELDTPVIISADGQAEIKVWTVDTKNGPQLRNTYTQHKFVVLTVAIYDPTLFGRSRETSMARTRLTGHHKVSLHQPCVLSGGGDKSIKVWAFLNGTSNDLIGEIPVAHSHNVRSIVVYHPTNPNEKPLFISGSYDKTAILWDLETLEALRYFKGIHTDYVFFTAIYDPRTQYLPSSDLPMEKTSPAVITTSYDCSFAIWDMFTGDAPRIHKKAAHKDSVTALAVFTPPFLSDEDPILITGSIDRLIHLWNLFTGEKIQTLVGHTDRVCYIKVYDPPNTHPVILSGGDDEKTILWEDTLYQKPFMPLRESVIRSFESDFQTTDWPMITEMAEMYGPLLFIENSNLFTVAVLRDRADFLLKFWDYLTVTLPTIKWEKFEPDGVNTTMLTNDPNVTKKDTYDILSIAILKCDLVSVRAIVLAWIKNLNKDMDNMLTQRSYHPSYFFPDDALPLLSKYYPTEFLKFICSIRIVRNNISLMGGKKQRKYIASDCRYEFRGSEHRVTDYDSFWSVFERYREPTNDAARQTNCLDRILARVDLALIKFIRSTEKFFDVPIEPQPVTSMMVPFKNCNKVAEYLKMFVSVSNQLDDVSIFDSEVGVVFLRYFWHIRGRGVHVLSFLKYLMFFVVFLVCIYAYLPHYGHKPGLIFLACLCIAGFAWFGIEEFIQMKKTYGSITSYHTVAHFADLWNAVDIIIVFNGILGLLLRIGYGCDTSTGRACLAITSVFMWFKILYFLRPFSTTGPLVAMILQIVAEIRIFLIVLFCVLAGYAQAFWILSNNDENLLFGTVSQSFLTSFLYMLGQNVEADFSGTASPYVATIFLVFFLITMMILMLNLLIALMGDVFSKVRSEGVGLWRKEQAAIISEESFLYEADKDLPKHLLVLKYTSEVGHDEIDYEENIDFIIETSDVPEFTRFVRQEETGEEDEEELDGGKADGAAAKEKKSEKKSVFRRKSLKK